jgi:hypothetical protein
MRENELLARGPGLERAVWRPSKGGIMPNRRDEYQMGGRVMRHKGLNQLLCAAVVNNGFRESLLRNPAQALATGYSGQSFSLTAEERDLVLRIKARRLEDLAGQIHRWITGEDNGHRQSVDAHSVISYNGNGRNGNGRNGDGHTSDRLEAGEPLIEVFGVPVPA